MCACSDPSSSFLLAAGADVVLLPFRDAATQAADLLASHSEKHSEQSSKIVEQWNSRD